MAPERNITKVGCSLCLSSTTTLEIYLSVTICKFEVGDMLWEDPRFNFYGNVTNCKLVGK